MPHGVRPIRARLPGGEKWGKWRRAASGGGLRDFEGSLGDLRGDLRVLRGLRGFWGQFWGQFWGFLRSRMGLG